MNDSVENTVNSYKNPFMYFYFWIKSELMDLDAIQQAITIRNKLIEYRQKLVNKQRSDEQQLTKLMTGKTTLKTMFKTKSGKEEKALNLKNTIAFISDDIVNYQKVINVANQYLAKNSIPWFKKDKMETYFSMLDLL